MKTNLIILNGNIINEDRIFKAHMIIENEKIADIIEINNPEEADIALEKYRSDNSTIIDANHKYIMPGVIDAHVHFRQPGLTDKGDIASESKAAVAGGTTSYMEMPNTVPNTTTQEYLNQKYEIAAHNSLANYSFYIGATSDNINEIKKTDWTKNCGIKLYAASTTGNMLVKDLSRVIKELSEVGAIISVHSEDDNIIAKNYNLLSAKFGNLLDNNYHHLIRTSEACVEMTKHIVKIAQLYNARIHLAHITTGAEIELLSKLNNKEKISSETSVNYLIFNNLDAGKTNQRKCNPAIKTNEDMLALIDGINHNVINIIASDHAPHLIADKNKAYCEAPSGISSIQTSLVNILEHNLTNQIKLKTIVEKMCHSPAKLFRICKRGFIRKGYYADLVIFEHSKMIEQDIKQSPIYSKCGWSVYKHQKLHSKITHTLVNGNLVFENNSINSTFKGKRLLFG